MTTDDKKKIEAYLSGPRNYAEGVALYRAHGLNLRLKRQFEVEDTATTREILIDELRKLAGLSLREFAALPRLAARAPEPVREAAHEEIMPGAENGEAANAPMPETVKKMIRFRERYPFLNSPDCPDVLKVLVADMFTAYGRYKEAHARLQQMPESYSAEAAAESERVVESYLENRAIREELDYYAEHGQLLGKEDKVREGQEEDMSALTDIELMNQLRSAQANESKHRRKLAEAEKKGSDTEKPREAFEKWSARRVLIQAEVERRKKK